MPAVFFSPYFQGPTLNSSGDPAVGYKLYTYDAGTTTPRATYTSQAGSSAQTNPIVLDARGEPPSPIWLISGETKFILKTDADVAVRTVDDVAGVGTLAAQDTSLGGYGFTNVGPLVGGTDTAVVVAGTTYSWQRNGTTLATGGILASEFSADAVGAAHVFAKSRNATIGSHTIVQSGDVLGSITAYGSNGTTFDPAAAIQFKSGGTPGASADMPGSIVFQTCPDGSATLADAVTIAASKVVTFATSPIVSAGNLTYDGTSLNVSGSSNALVAQCTASAAFFVGSIVHQATSGDNQFIAFDT